MKCPDPTRRREIDSIHQERHCGDVVGRSVRESRVSAKVQNVCGIRTRRGCATTPRAIDAPGIRRAAPHEVPSQG